MNSAKLKDTLFSAEFEVDFILVTKEGIKAATQK